MPLDQAISDWTGGRLPLYDDLGPLGLVAFANAEEAEYKPIGDGWAIRADLPLTFELTLGVEVEFAVRDGQLQCVAIRSLDSGGELTTSLLRKVEPHLRPLTREMWRRAVVRLAVKDGTVVAVHPSTEQSGAGVWWSYSDTAPVADVEFDRRRQPLTDDKLRRVAELYREAEAKRASSRTAYIKQEFPNYSDTAIRNWVRHARRRGFLGDAPSPRIAGEQPTQGADR